MIDSDKVIPCQRGHIYPHGQDVLAASTNTRGGIAGKLAAQLRTAGHGKRTGGGE